MTDLRYFARSASDHTDNWPFWFVADRQQGGLNVTVELIHKLFDGRHVAAPLVTKEWAEAIAFKANSVGA